MSSSNDVLLAKFTSNGNVSWIRILGKGGSADIGKTVQQTTGGDYIVFGSSNGYGFGDNNYNILLAKFSSNGTLIWAKTDGTDPINDNDLVNYGMQTSDGGYIMTGRAGSSVHDIFVIKFSEHGDSCTILNCDPTVLNAENNFTLMSHNVSSIFVVDWIVSDIWFSERKLDVAEIDYKWKCVTTAYGTCWKPGVCQCIRGYYEECDVTTCFGVYSNTSDMCSEHGVCWPENNCTCDENYFGYDCNYTWCNGNPTDKNYSHCSDHGRCWPYEKCDCDENYYGEVCNITQCNGVYSNTSDMCSEHGLCWPENNCSCYENYFGSDCNYTWCNGNPTDKNYTHCSDHGRCWPYEKCDCDENYYGEICNITQCDGLYSNESAELVCNGRGECESPDNCTCLDGNYTGQYCEVFGCFGLLSTSVRVVCSGHGECIGADKCLCNKLYPGESCNKWTCFNKSIEDPEACVNGICVDFDKCFCQIGYSSEILFGRCTDYYCGSHMSVDPYVCNNRGKCVSPQTCECKGNYEGELCETWSCGTEYTDPKTCSGHGRCKKPETCDCNYGFTGKLCTTNTLYGSVMAPVLSLFGLILLCCSLCFLCACCLCISVFFCVLFVSLVGLGFYIYFQRYRLKKFGKLKNVDILLREQELEEDGSVAHIRINKKLFEINIKEIKVEKILGEGGSNAVVYKALWKNNIVAFKCFRTRHVCSNQDDFDDFEREVQVLSSVSHPHIIAFFGACLDPPRVGIIMEFCENGDISQFLKYYSVSHDGEKYPFEEKLRICEETAASLDYLHSRSIIHRDLKLENVLLDSRESCKLMDFGLSKIVERISRTKTTKIGTSCYMSPEIIRTGNYSEKCDCFSFSILIYILFTENLTPYGGDRANVEIKVSMDPRFRPDLNVFRNSFSESTNTNDPLKRSKAEYRIKTLVDIMKTCWDNDPKVRYSMQEIVKRLGNLTDIDEQEGKEKLLDYIFDQKNDEIEDEEIEVSDIVDERLKEKFIRTEKTLRQIILNVNKVCESNKNFRREDFFDGVSVEDML